MASTKYSIILAILLVASRPGLLIQGQETVPCLFFFSDSQLDDGNNNGLITSARSNYPPYGIDYPGGVPTGRFTNGLNTADFLAKFLGFSESIPPFVTTRGLAILRGLNYASGGSGILDVSGIQLGGRFSMNQQLQNHLTTVVRFNALLGNARVAAEKLRQCLYVVNMGNNDYINNYFYPNSTSRALYTPERFADKLIQTFSQQLKVLYTLGSRKVAVYGVGLIGCIPQELSFYPPTNGSPCVDEINNAVALYNSKLVTLINELNFLLPDARYTFINSTNIALGDPSLAGVKVANAPCCEVQDIIGQCVQNGAVCSNRDQYAFFDNFHPTQIAYNASASRSFKALLPTDVSPVDIRTLLQN